SRRAHPSKIWNGALPIEFRRLLCGPRIRAVCGQHGVLSLCMREDAHNANVNEAGNHLPATEFVLAMLGEDSASRTHNRERLHERRCPMALWRADLGDF